MYNLNMTIGYLLLIKIIVWCVFPKTCVIKLNYIHCCFPFISSGTLIRFGTHSIFIFSENMCWILFTRGRTALIRLNCNSSLSKYVQKLFGSWGSFLHIHMKLVLVASFPLSLRPVKLTQGGTTLSKSYKVTSNNYMQICCLWTLACILLSEHLKHAQIKYKSVSKAASWLFRVTWIMCPLIYTSRATYTCVVPLHLYKGSKKLPQWIIP